MAFNVILGFAAGRHIPSSAGHHRPKQKLVLRVQDGFFRTMPLLTKASFRRRVTARKKRPTCVERVCFGRDSVGIRTQDPQLRRLLLYPAELPSRSVSLLGSAGLIPKVAANIDVFVVICKMLRKRLFRVVLIV